MKLPAVCHGTLIGLPLPYVDGQPQRLSCLADWFDHVDDFSISESFDLNADAALPGWSGSSSDSGLNLRVEVSREVEPLMYMIRIVLREGTAELDDASWHHVKIAQGPPFESTGNQHTYPPSGSWDAVDLLD